MAPPRYVPPHKRGEWRAAAAGGGMEPEEEIAEAEFGEQRRLGTARRVSARTPSADSVHCRVASKRCIHGPVKACSASHIACASAFSCGVLYARSE